MLSMGTKGNLREKGIITHIINGINDSDLKKNISKDYYFCTQLLQDINLYMTYNEIKTEKPFSKQQGPIKTVERKTESQPENKLRCYNCSKFGHMAMNCPEPQKKQRCGKCNRTGHSSENCKVTAKVNHIQAATEGEVLKEVTVNGILTTAFIDPGSNRTLVRETFANSVGQGEQCYVSLKGFAGGEYAVTRFVRATIGIDNVTTDVLLLIVKDDMLIENILLGRDVLCQDGRKLVIENLQCHIIEESHIKGNEQIAPEDQQKLTALMSRYKTVFAEKLDNLGKCSKVKAVIRLTSNIPIRKAPYKIPFARRQIVNEMIEQLLAYEIIRPSESPYASPVVLIPKKNGEYRLCVDYRALNDVTEKMIFPMPIIEEQFAQLAGNKYFTVLDLRMGYHQIEIAEECKQYTAFVTNENHYEYNRLPFGLANAPAIFQNLMNSMVKRMKSGEILAYLDDIIIPSRTIEEGLERLQKFLGILQEYGLTLRRDKCRFMMTQIEHLGHVISESGVTPGCRKLIAVKEFPPPATVSDVRRYLGLTGFFRKFVPGYSIIAEPLTQLLRKSSGEFKWGAEQQRAFEELRNKLCDDPVLVLYDVKAKHEVHTDASAIGLAGVLLQSNDGKSWNPTAYYSRRCSEVESRCHSYELEVLAVVETLERFRVYLLGKQFTLVTDCAAIATTKKQTELKSKIARWWMKLLEYDFVVVHRQGSRLAHVDALSRAPAESAASVEEAGFVYNVDVMDNDWLLTMQMRDDKLKQVLNALKTGRDPQYQQFKKEYVVTNHRLYRKTDQGNRFVVPKAIRYKVVEHCHDKQGHFAQSKTIERLKRMFWFPRMAKYVKEYVESCASCCYNKLKGGKTEGELHFSEILPIPFTSIHIDHLGPFIRSNRGYTHILAISDAFTKAAVIKAVRNTKTAPVLNAINELTTYFGLPTRITTDRGTSFTARLFAEYCKKNHIRHVQCAVRSPRANGQVERVNRVILDYLRTTTEKPKDWDLKLRELQWTINSQKNATTGFSPNELIFDYKLRDIVQNEVVAALTDEVTNETIPVAEKRMLALDNIHKEREKWKKRFDQKHVAPAVHNEGDLIVIQNEPPATGESRKLEPRYKGPFVVTRNLGNDRYLVENIPGMESSNRKFCSVYAADKIKKWCSANPTLEPDSDDEENSDDESGAIQGSGEAEL